MRPHEVRRTAGTVLLALAFGTLSAILKGNGGGVRDAIGNVSAPWLIVPLLAGCYATRGRPVLGAILGVVTTMAAILGFYAANTFVLDLGPHRTLTDLGLALSPGTVLAPYGAVSGAIFGAVGAWSAERSPSALGWIVAALLAFEPLAWIASFAARGVSLGGSFAQPAVWVAEAAIGMAFAGYMWHRRCRHASGPE